MSAGTEYQMTQPSGCVSAISLHPHPAPDPLRLTQVRDQTLLDLIALRHAGVVPGERLAAAGIPALTDLEQERQRRERDRLQASS